MKAKGFAFLAGTGALAGAAALSYAAYRKDMEAAQRHLAIERQRVDSPDGAIEFAESGDGPAVLVIHGAGGGFDQGLELGHAILGNGFRVLAPSRFGYLGTPLPRDASPEAQADAYARLLDALQLDTVSLIGISAGAPSAMQFCVRHPQRCSALVLVAPLAWAPDHVAAASPSLLFTTVVETIVASDFLFWSAMKIAPMTLMQTILGTPVQDYRNAPASERREADRVLRTILPIRARAAGIANDRAIAANLTRCDLESIRARTLVISTADDGYDTYDSGFYTAEEIREGTFVGFPTGGHLLLGHGTEVRSEVRKFLGASRDVRPPAPIAV